MNGKVADSRDSVRAHLDDRVLKYDSQLYILDPSNGHEVYLKADVVNHAEQRIIDGKRVRGFVAGDTFLPLLKKNVPHVEVASEMSLSNRKRWESFRFVEIEFGHNRPFV